MRELIFALLLTGAASLGSAANKVAALTVPSIDGIPIAYEVHGQAEPALVLVHGWSCDRSYWKEQVDYLSPQYRLVLVDLAGHGESGAGRKDYTMASFGADVAAVVDSLKLQKVVLAGHSMGGDVVIEAAKSCLWIRNRCHWRFGSHRSPTWPCSRHAARSVDGSVRRSVRIRRSSTRTPLDDWIPHLFRRRRRSPARRTLFTRWKS